MGKQLALIVVRLFIVKNKRDIKGTWQIIQWCPCLTSREWLNIGVGFKHGDKQYFKYLDSFSKVAFIYDDETVKHLKHVIELTSKLFNSGCYDFSPQIKLIDIGFSRCYTVEEGLNRSYERVVSLRRECL